jgi:uncharacterized membrane protein YkvA (DUF1232 family)
MARDADAAGRASKPEGGRKGRGGRSRGRGPGIRRLLAALAFLPVAGRAPLYARLLWSLVLDARTPLTNKVVLAAGLGYLVLGRDLVPDRIPVLGQLDDLVVVALATDLFLDGVDEELLNEKLDEVGISRAAFDEDVARVRRLLPRPVRQAARSVPGLIRAAGDTVAQSGLPPRLRAWLS